MTHRTFMARIAKVRALLKAASEAVSLCQNPKGVPFQCHTCKFQSDGHCENPNPKLNGRAVQPVWCCNLYKHRGIKVIVS